LLLVAALQPEEIKRMDTVQANVMGRAPVVTYSPEVRLPTVQVAKRFSVVVRTVERWLQDPNLNFPKPIVVNKRRYWRLEELERWERSRASEG
jgi:hypothetical protein